MKNTPERSKARLLARHVLAALLIAVPLAVESPAQIPREIETQARLVDGQGAEVTGSISITVLIYALPTGGTALWQHTYDTTAQGGVINLRLGRVADTKFPDNLFDTGPLYITFQVGSDPEMTPRRELASAPFAVRADCVSNVDSTTAFETGVVESLDIMDGGVASCDVLDGSLVSSDIMDGGVQSCDVMDGTLVSADIMDGGVQWRRRGHRRSLHVQRRGGRARVRRGADHFRCGGRRPRRFGHDADRPPTPVRGRSLRRDLVRRLRRGSRFRGVRGREHREDR